MPNLICPLQLIGLHTEHPVAHPNMGLDQVQGPGPLLRAEIRIWEPGGAYLFSALGGGVLHGAAAADHQLQVLQGPQILQRVFARHDEVCALAGRDRAGHLANACQLRVAQGGGVEGKTVAHAAQQFRFGIAAHHAGTVRGGKVVRSFSFIKPPM